MSRLPVNEAMSSGNGTGARMGAAAASDVAVPAGTLGAADKVAKDAAGGGADGAIWGGPDVPNPMVGDGVRLPTFEEFDGYQGSHVFSAEYERRKRILTGSYAGRNAQAAGAFSSQASGQRASRARQAAGYRSRGFRLAAAAVAAAVIVAPTAAWAVANYGDFFAGAFGNEGRESVAAQETVHEYKDGQPVYATYYNRDYVAVNEEAAEALIGDYIANGPVSAEVGGHTVTVLSTVRDANSMVVHYTVECPAGVTALEWSNLTNQGKGAIAPDDAPVKWEYSAGTIATAAGSDASAESAGAEAVEEGGAPEAGNHGESAGAGEAALYALAVSEDPEAAKPADQALNLAGRCTLVDSQLSTPEKLVCYDYLTFLEPIAADAAVTMDFVVGGGSLQLPMGDAVPSRLLSAADGAVLEVSPLGLCLDEYAGLGIDGAGEPGDVDEISVTMADGSTYTVFSEEAQADNTSYVLGRDGDVGSAYLCVFNRLVDPAAIASIQINGVTFA